MKKTKKINWHIAVVYIVLTLYTLYTLYPIFLMMVTSLKNNLEIMKNPAGLPQEWVFDGFITLFQKENFGRYFLNSIFVTGTSVVILLVVTIFRMIATNKMRKKAPR